MQKLFTKISGPQTSAWKMFYCYFDLRKRQKKNKKDSFKIRDIWNYDLSEIKL